MNKKMRELLAAIEAKQTEAKGFLEANDTEKAQGCMTEIEDLQAQYEIAEKLFRAEQNEVPDTKPTEKTETAEEADVKAFAGYIRSMVGKTATPQNITMGNNGAIIPSTIAKRIINQVKEICPIFAGVTMFNVKGTLKIPVYGDKLGADGANHNINVAFSDEFTELTADAGAFTSVDLGGFLAGALVLIGKSVVNNADIDVVNFIVNEMSRRIAWFLRTSCSTVRRARTPRLPPPNNCLQVLHPKSPTSLLSFRTGCRANGRPMPVGRWLPARLRLSELKYVDGTYILQPDASLTSLSSARQARLSV